MIQANELRIGNLVIADGLHEGRVMTIEQIGTRGTLSECNRVILFKEHEVGEFAKNLFPIPLTAEILDDNFEKDCTGKFVPCGIKIMRDEESNCFRMYNAKVMYVHQLQNLVFSLTGKELEIKL